ncbi:hypothetical protein [Bifidobacterium simiiventris]|uniref:hypothetical protein n=1 Tax=Bifidobacterium simiiventris TaxID=2834434 RepID=UPI001C587F1D|nr:hypothetical protein [Bifidobacterium simiiventris]MBW3078580.1 hypothetical protein [Bifidobacterium simiiventris]
MGSVLVEKAEWLGGRNQFDLPPTARLVLQHMALKAMDNGGVGVGDDRVYGQTAKGAPAQLFYQSRERACKDMDMDSSQYTQQITKLKACGLVESVKSGRRGQIAEYRLHVAEIYDARKSLEAKPAV